MKFRTVASRSNEIEFSNTLVVADNYHLRKYAAAKIGTNCRVFDNLITALDYDTKDQSITLVESRLSKLSQSLDTIVQRWETEAFQQFSFAYPSRLHESVLRELQCHPLSDGFALVDLDRASDLTYVSLSPSRSSDRPIEDFMLGYTIGTRDRNIDISHDVLECETCEDNELRLFSALGFIAEYESNAVPSARSSGNGMSTELKQLNEDLKNANSELAAVRAENVKLQARCDYLDERYRALAESRLGRVMRRYWSMRK